MYWHIILTEKCNSQCRYCYEKSMKEFDNGLTEKWKFDFNVPCDTEVEISKLKQFISKDKNPVLIFYGGEPLLKIGKIKQIMDAIPARYCMQTNGKLLNELPKEYMNKFSRILVSLDGDEKRTDFNRGKSTYKKVIENIKLIRKNGYKGEIVGRMTIVIPDLLEQVKNLLKIHEIDSVHWQLDMGFYKNDFVKYRAEWFAEEYNKSLTELIYFWIAEMKKGKVLKFYPLLGIFESLYYNSGKPCRLRCGAGHAGYAITTKGDITTCPIMNNITDFYVGNLDSNPGNLKQIDVDEPCTSCDYLDLCGGRCLYSNKAKLWPSEGEKLICKTIIHLIEEMKRILPEVKSLTKEGIVHEKDFEYEKYFGPEIIP